jgi:hypothetical protein
MIRSRIFPFLGQGAVVFGRFSFAALLAVSVGVGSAEAGFTSYVIREGGGAPGILTNNDYVPGATEFVIAAGGQKAGWGTSQLDGIKVGDITRLAITRLDDRTRFSAGSGPRVAPYFNIWITDGTNYAVIGNEPSDPVFQSLYNNGYDLSWDDIADKPAKAYENNDLTWLPNNGVGMTFADIANFTIQAPTVGELTTGWVGLGTGAPRELGTNVAYGFSWVFGDTLSNYVSGMESDEGYVVINPIAVPEPGAFALGSAALIGLGCYRARRKRAASKCAA